LDNANGNHIDSFFEDEYKEDFFKEQKKDFRQPKEQKKGFKDQKFLKMSTRHSRIVEDELDTYDPDRDEHFRRPKGKNIFKGAKFHEKPKSPFNRSNFYKNIDFGNSQVPATRWEPVVGNSMKVDTFKLPPFEKNFYQLHPDTKKFTDVSAACIVCNL